LTKEQGTTNNDSNLKEYQEKRNFRRTDEPQGGESAPKKKTFFVIQEHDANNLHFDFRLEIDVILKSWAVPKGPSTDPAVKRLALPTEDHPIEYADFEGVIPEDQYGAGTVLIWDTGPYRNLRAEKEGDSRSLPQSVADGKLEVWLEGKKLQGGYALIRTDIGDEERWLLIKVDDEEADARRNPISSEPESVLSGRTLDEIREEADD
jgi:DNA ligase D-like protein (predicted 3'-phosphoesterase)